MVTSVHLKHDHFLKDMVKHKVSTGARLQRRMKRFHMGANDFRNELEIPFFMFYVQFSLLNESLIFVEP